ncbi:uncharacterized protein LOC144127850 [Amblyomma americanum]
MKSNSLRKTAKSKQQEILDIDVKIQEKQSSRAFTIFVLFLSQVCERHFKPFDMVNRTSYTDTKTGKVIEGALKLVRLRPDAVSRILPDCPAYLPAPNAGTSREAPDEKRTRREAAALQDAINLSVEAHQAEEERNKIDHIQALLKCIPCIKVSEFWTVVSQHDFILFLDLTVDGAPAIKKSVKLTEDLSLKLYFRDVEVTKLEGVEIIPKTLNDIRCLTGLLDAVESALIRLLPSANLKTTQVAY